MLCDEMHLKTWQKFDDDALPTLNAEIAVLGVSEKRGSCARGREMTSSPNWVKHDRTIFPDDISWGKTRKDGWKSTLSDTRA